MAKTSKQAGLRKQPTQARSQARVADILKAAGALLGEVGYDGLTTNLIAERAKIPVGSIYQFFESKDDIVAGVVEQFRERILRLAGENWMRQARGPTAGPSSGGWSTALRPSRPRLRPSSACSPPVRRIRASTSWRANCGTR